ncbi:hypothetical protein COCOBI_03-6060 [Coccomyxa sp. Obi]|nr:hypothetical protein COCOBI_03-6060 [Coccomyxa sp. Obi]
MAEAPTPTFNLADGLKTASESLEREASEVPSINSVPQTTNAVVASGKASALLQDPLAKVQFSESSTHIESSTGNHLSTAVQSPQDWQGSETDTPVSLTDLPRIDQYSSFPEEEQQSQQLPPEAHASSLQPSTPPLSSPAGASPTSRPASVTEGEDSSSAGPSEYPPLAEVAEGIREAIESRLRVSEVRRHPPEAMDESLPALRVVAAEIETPGQSPRGDIMSPSTSGDSFGKALMHQAMRLKTAMLNQKVNFMDIARNPGLAKAAKAELDGESRSGATHLDPNAFPREADVERQRAALAAIDLEAEEESGINRELAGVMCTRLDAARRATEKLLGVLQACAGAEAAYTRALSAASKVRLVGGCDGASLHAALDGFSDLPFMVGQAHVRVGAGLSDTTKGMQDVVGALRQACADISAESAKVHRAIDAARRHLQTAFADHTAACRFCPLPPVHVSSAPPS